MADEKPDELPTIFIGTCAFRKDSTPVLGNMGSRIGRVVVIPAQTWHRLLAEHPTLGAAAFRVGDLG